MRDVDPALDANTEPVPESASGDAEGAEETQPTIVERPASSTASRTEDTRNEDIEAPRRRPRRDPRAIWPLAILRIGGGPYFPLADGGYDGAWNVRLGAGLMRQTPIEGLWWRVEADLAYLRQAGAQGIGGGFVGTVGSMDYVMAGYSVRWLGMKRDDFDNVLRHGLATRWFAGLLAFDLEHERFLASGDDAVVLTFSVDLAALALGISLVTRGGP